jgi:hypothetical protein
MAVFLVAFIRPIRSISFIDTDSDTCDVRGLSCVARTASEGVKEQISRSIWLRSTITMFV